MKSNTSLEFVEQVRTRCIELGIKPEVSAVTQIVRQLLPGSTQGELVALIDVVMSEISGLGPLENLLLLPGLTDILVNRFDEVWVDQGAGLQRTQVSWSSEQAARRFEFHRTSNSHSSNCSIWEISQSQYIKRSSKLFWNEKVS